MAAKVFIMACYFPITGYRSKAGRNTNGAWPLVFNPAYGYRDLEVKIPCGRCIGCKLERSRQWAIRCLHESKMHDENCFITLTYNEENLPEGDSLVKEDYVLFMKRLRKAYSDKKISFFHCGEYGEKLGRPHHHACLFGVNFEDRKKFKKIGENQLFTSTILEKLWKKGHCLIGEVTFESAAYVARYCTKKITGEKAEEYYNGRLPEYVTMSLKPAIGKTFALKFKDDIMYNDNVIVRGMQLRPTRYYDKIYEGTDHYVVEQNKIKRKKLAQSLESDNTTERLLVKEKIKQLSMKEKRRTYENS